MTITLTTEELGLVLDKLKNLDSHPFPASRSACAEASCPPGSDFDIDSKIFDTSSDSFFPDENECFPAEVEAIAFLNNALEKKIKLDKTKKLSTEQ